MPPVPNYADDEFVITIAPLSFDEMYRRSEDPASGAVVVMSGTVRNKTDGQAVKYLEYQAYEPMAKVVFQQIARQIRSQWPDVNRVVIHHRVGKLVIGEISVLIAVSTPHRAEAFAACKFGIDTLKHNAPIWKKEFFSDGASEWVQGCRAEAE
ncbi:molybdopterin synthase subunit MoaE [[Leptolyngbya] sp. PCC 7376]|uniref:molybdenum cofactor biosynthesis protein MoaE n=1 Tax=[Leptolyngbya] sp. PCC 7376 TaxID=111781 RepID=UPI00029EE001|nr:molybdenum cofactor biosynthesis protein MoaE [[Leptolyngbya] sp. PCC 7376]AFY39002.1 molybdopterin synthase subunit MoaE [[Leptolyngbya] sp. PCC 7376]